MFLFVVYLCNYWIFLRAPAGAERCSRLLQKALNRLRRRMRAAEHAARGPSYLLERRHGLAEIVARGGGVLVNPVDANGKLVPKKMTSRFWGVYWYKSSSKWRAEYFDDSEPRRKCHVGYFVDEEVAALAYNEAVIAADLADVRVMNRVDPTGRPIPKDQD